jgi:hypothetical protein
MTMTKSVRRSLFLLFAIVAAALGLLLGPNLVPSTAPAPVQKVFAPFQQEADARALLVVKHTLVSDGVARRLTLRDCCGWASGFTLAEGSSKAMYDGGRQVWIPTGCEVQKDGNLFGSAVGRSGFYKGFDHQFTQADFRIWCP